MSMSHGFFLLFLNIPRDSFCMRYAKVCYIPFRYFRSRQTFCTQSPVRNLRAPRALDGTSPGPSRPATKCLTTKNTRGYFNIHAIRTGQLDILAERFDLVLQMPVRKPMRYFRFSISRQGASWVTQSCKI